MKNFVATFLAMVIAIASVFGIGYALKNKTDLFDKSNSSSSISSEDTSVDSGSSSQPGDSSTDETPSLNYEEMYNNLIQQQNGKELVFGGIQHVFNIHTGEDPYSFRDKSDISNCYLYQSFYNALLLLSQDDYTRYSPRDIDFYELYSVDNHTFSLFKGTYNISDINITINNSNFDSLDFESYSYSYIASFSNITIENNSISCDLLVKICQN